MPRVVALLCTLLLAACAQATTRTAPARDDGSMQDDSMLDDGMPHESMLQKSMHHDIALPRALKAGERVLLEVRVGAIGSGQEVVLRTADGRLIGTVSPYGIRPGNAAGTYVVPVPPGALAHALRDGRLRLRILIERAGAAARPVRADEVLGVRAVVVD
jgi:hypothetical protein